MKVTAFPKDPLVRVIGIFFPNPGRVWCIVETSGTTKGETEETIYQHTHSSWHGNLSWVQNLFTLEKWFYNCPAGGKWIEWGRGWEEGGVHPLDSHPPLVEVHTFSSVVTCLLCIFSGFFVKKSPLEKKKHFGLKTWNPFPWRMCPQMPSSWWTLQ